MATSSAAHEFSYQELQSLLAKKKAEIEEKHKQLGLQGKLKKSLNEATKRAVKVKSVDACFVFDCTASMRNHLKFAMEKMREIQSFILNWLGSGSSVRFSFVGFRDFEAPRPFEILDFTGDVAEVEAFLDQIEAITNYTCYDTAEDVIGGLERAVAMDWTASTRILYLVCDAPAHGLRFHGGKVTDNHDDTIRQWGPTDLLFTKMADLHLHFLGIQIGTWTNQMFEVFKELRTLNDDRLTTLVLRADSPGADFVECLLKGSAESLSGSLGLLNCSKDRGAQDGRIEHNLTLEQFSWEDAHAWPEEYVNVTSLFRNDGDHQFVEHSATLRLRVCQSPFAEGSMRYAFPAEDADKGTRLVVKAYKIKDDASASRAAVLADVRAQVVADYFARKFSTRLPQMAVQFVQVQLMERPDGSDFRCCALEEFIPGEHTKYTNNNGYVSKNSELAQTFSHFTWQASGGEIMVTDIQGVRSCVLTDPQIHCEGSSMFGKGNLGVSGMDNFFLQHCCGDICRRLELTPNAMQRVPSLPRSISCWSFLDGLRGARSLADDNQNGTSLVLDAIEVGPLQCEGKCQTLVCVREEEYSREMKNCGGIFCETCKKKVKNSMRKVQCSGEGCKGYVEFSIFVLHVKGSAAPKYCGLCRSRHEDGTDDLTWLLV